LGDDQDEVLVGQLADLSVQSKPEFWLVMQHRPWVYPLDALPKTTAAVAAKLLIRFHRVVAPNAQLRARVVPQGQPAQARAATEAADAAGCEAETVQPRPHRISWARLLKRVFDIDMVGPRTGCDERAHAPRS
jgi:hypothetical protein